MFISGPKMFTAAIFILIIFINKCELGLTHQLQVGFYSKTCPDAESIVRNVVQQSVNDDPHNAAALLRLHFHDCFVEGCDGSILIMNVGNDAERFAGGNAGLRGFEIIDEAKTELERLCPGVVSCSDIVALAARDAVVLAQGPFYDVPTGRRDGRVANKSNAVNLPEAEDSIETLKSKFSEKGLSDQDLVLLSAGAHTIGTTACFFVTPRLDARDPTINPHFFRILRSTCPHGGDADVRLPLDHVSQFVFDDQILRNIKMGFGVIASDSVLYQDKSTKNIIDSYLSNNRSLKADFARAMVKMGVIGVKIGRVGEIRRICNTIN